MAVFRKGDKIWVPESERIRQEESERQKDRITCDAPINLTGANCPECDGRIIVHCPRCNQKVTGCQCTMKKRIDSVKEELIERLFS